mgnify:CR=1 FL=1
MTHSVLPPTRLQQTRLQQAHNVAYGVPPPPLPPPYNPPPPPPAFSWEYPNVAAAGPPQAASQQAQPPHSAANAFQQGDINFPVDPDQLSRVCWYHQRFGALAERCETTCPLHGFFNGYYTQVNALCPPPRRPDSRLRPGRGSG